MSQWTFTVSNFKIVIFLEMSNTYISLIRVIAGEAPHTEQWLTTLPLINVAFFYTV